jgi:poly(beta-D-mannuronate) lyase
MRRSLAALFLAVLGGVDLSRAAESPLQSPWDSHSIALTDAPYTCPASPQIPRDLNIGSYYTDEHHSIVDPARKEAHDGISRPIHDLSNELARAADDFRSTGSRAAAQCVITLLEAAAHDRALAGSMLSGQAYYEQAWALSSWAITYLKVRGNGMDAPEQTKSIAKWLKNLAESVRANYDRKLQNPHSGRPNNLYYWAGLAVSAAGVVCNDRGLFKWGMDAYKHGVSTITSDGVLPAEMQRAARALHYHLFAVGPLIFLAEFGEANGLDLYAEKNYAIKRLVARCISGLQDHSYFEAQTGKPQDIPDTIQGDLIGWAKPYVRRFPDPQISMLLEKAPRISYSTWGGLPPD